MAMTQLKLTGSLACLLSLGLFCASAVEQKVSNVPSRAAAPDEETEQFLTKEQLQDLHAKIDSDKNGKISLNEAMEYASNMRKITAGKGMASVLEESFTFEEMDTNKDGKLSLQEHLKDTAPPARHANSQEKKEVAQRKRFQTDKFKAADSNGDGFLDTKELLGLFFPETQPGVLEVTTRETMRLKDSDADGKLSPREFWEYAEADADVELPEEELEEFQQLDKDKSGSLDVNELKIYESGVMHTEKGLMKLLEVCDKDRDQQCTLQELENSRQALATTDVNDQLLEWSQGHEL